MFNLNIEYLYNIYHRETFKAQRGFYPKSIKNFNISDDKKELLLRFADFCRKNYNDVEPSLYIKACSEFYKRPFKLSVLGSLVGNKIYKEYKLIHKNDTIIDTDDDIIESIMTSLNTINEWHTMNSEKNAILYFKDTVGLIPKFVIDMLDGRMSTYFMACLSIKTLDKLFSQIDSEAFFEMLKINPNEFLNNDIKNKRNVLFKNERLRTVFDKIFEKFSSLSNK